MVATVKANTHRRAMLICANLAGRSSMMDAPDAERIIDGMNIFPATNPSNSPAKAAAHAAIWSSVSTLAMPLSLKLRPCSD